MPGTELAKAYVQIIPSAKGIRRQVEDVLGKDLPPAGESGGKTLGQSLAGKLKAVIVAAGIGKFISSLLNHLFLSCFIPTLSILRKSCIIHL